MILWGTNPGQYVDVGGERIIEDEDREKGHV
jgi:hypothetical protein